MNGPALPPAVVAVAIPVLLVVASLGCSVFTARFRRDTRTVDDRYELALAARIAEIRGRAKSVTRSFGDEPQIAYRLAREDLPALVRVVSLLLEERDLLNRGARRLMCLSRADDAEPLERGRREGHALASMSAAQIINEVLAEAFGLWDSYDIPDDIQLDDGS